MGWISNQAMLLTDPNMSMCLLKPVCVTFRIALREKGFFVMVKERSLGCLGWADHQLLAELILIELHVVVIGCEIIHEGEGESMLCVGQEDRVCSRASKSRVPLFSWPMSVFCVWVCKRKCSSLYHRRWVSEWVVYPEQQSQLFKDWLGPGWTA